MTPFGQGRPFLALTGGGDFSHDDGWCNAPPFSLFGCAEKRKPSRGPSRRFAAHLDGPCTVQKRKAAGAEFDRGGQIRPNAGIFSDGARKFASLLPAASDSVPPFGALPQLSLLPRLFCRFDARPLAPLPALRPWLKPSGTVCSPAGCQR